MVGRACYSLLSRHALWLSWAFFFVSVPLLLTVAPPPNYWFDTLRDNQLSREAFAVQRFPMGDVSAASVRGPGNLLTYWRVWIHPMVLPRWFAPPEWHRVVSTSMAYYLTAAAGFVLARALSNGRIAATLCGQALAFFSFHPLYTLTQPLGNPIGSYLYPHLEMYAYVPAIGSLMIALMVRISTSSTAETMASRIALFVTLPVAALLAEPLYGPTLLASSVLVCTVIACQSALNGAFAGVAALALMGSGVCLAGIPWFYSAIGQLAARFTFPNELASEPQIFDQYAPLVFQGGLATLSQVFLFFVSVYLSRDPRRHIQRFAVAMLFMQMMQLMIGCVYLFTGVRWYLPSPSYLELGLLISYTATLFTGLLGITRRWSVEQKSGFPFNLASMNWSYAVPIISLVIPGAIAAVATAFMPATARDRTPTPETLPAANRIFDHLRRAVAYPSDGSFRGSVATSFGVPGGGVMSRAGGRYLRYRLPETPYDKFLLEEIALRYIKTFDPRLILVTLWANGIPTIEDYSATIPSDSYFLFSRCFARPWDYFQRNHLFITVPRAKLLQSLGVRFLLTDAPLPIQVAATVSVQENRYGDKLYLQEFREPNTASYSPTKIRVETEAATILAILCNNQFDFGRDVVLTEELPEHIDGLAAVAESGIQFADGKICVSGIAPPGRHSMLLLPVRFSNALKVSMPGRSRRAKDSGAEREVLLVRANLTQAAIVFEGEMNCEITHDVGVYGPFVGLRKDVQDWKALGIVEDGTVSYPPGFQPYALWGRNATSDR